MAENKVTIDEAAEIIGCTPRTLRTKYKAWGVPYYKIAGFLRFSPHELYGWIESKSHNSIKESPSNENIGQ